MTLSEKMKELVSKRGITYTFLSSQTGIPVDAISRSLRGKRRLPADEMVALCKTARIDLAELIGTDPPTPREPAA